METLIEQAKKLKKNKQFEEAIELYAQLYSVDTDKWLAQEYAYCLKQLNRIDEAIEISKNTYKKEKSFSNNNNLLAWLLYDKYFKDTKDSCTSEELKTISDIALFVTDLVEQSDTSPYERIIFKAIKVLKASNRKSDRILALVNKLDVHLLDGKANTYIDTKSGNEKEFQSNKEAYYAIKTKALFDNKKYEDCIEYCKEALSTVAQFHHDNQIWIEVRMAECRSMLGNKPEAIEQMKELASKKSHWTLMDKIGDLYWDLGDKQNALLYMCMAALTMDPPKMKVALYYKMARVLESMNEMAVAYRHMVFMKSIREKEQWVIPSDVATFLALYEREKSAELPNIEVLKNFWLKTIYRMLNTKHGTITIMDNKRKTGNISCGSEHYFFRISSIYDRQIKPGDKVIFCLTDSFDLKKNKPSKIANYIKMDK